MRTESERNAYFQKLYPTVNNDDLLEFRIPPNQKSQMCLSGVLLRFVIRLPQPADQTVTLLPDNYLGAKQFSSLEVRINGEAVSRRNCANEYLNSVQMQYVTNFSVDYATTSCRTIGLFDDADFDGEYYKTNAAWLAKVKDNRKGVNGDYVYEIVMPIDSSIFTSNDLLPSKTPVELSFERCKSKLSAILVGTITDAITGAIKSVLELEDPYLIVPFVNDLGMEEKERTAVSNAIKVKYDDYAINRFNISKETPNARIPNALTGPLPRKIFFGLRPLDEFNGDYKSPSTTFKRFGVKKATLYVDGNVLSGYPMSISANAVTLPYVRFQQNINRYMNCYASRSINMDDFKNFMLLYSAELDPSTSGSITFEFDFEEAPTDDLVLVTCCIYDRTVEIDSFRNFQVV